MKFSRRVWAMVEQIPEGKVVAYGDVAAAMGSPRAARQVGWALSALGSERARTVPWQRVVLKSGGIAFRGDPVRGPLQERLLRAEGVTFRGERVDMAACRWRPAAGTWIDPALDGVDLDDVDLDDVDLDGEDSG